MATAVKSLAELRTMDRNKLKAMNKDALIDILLTAIENVAQPAPQDEQMNKIASNVSDVANDVAELKRMLVSPDGPIGKRFAEMQTQIDKQAQTILQQQRFLEELDRRERETKIVVLGVPEEGELLQDAEADEDKLQKVWSTIEEPFRITSHRRLGRRQGTRKRPILVTVETKDIRDGVIAKARKLKDAGEQFGRIFIKRDEHPSVRNEWKRLKAAEATEKERPENVGCNIRLDMRERRLYKDGIVIDKWNPQYF